MKLIHKYLNGIIEINESFINVLVIENQSLFSNLLIDLYNQTKKGQGGFLLSMDNKPIEISKNIELITDLISFEINKKNLLNRLFKKAEQISKDEDYILKTRELHSYIKNYVELIVEDIDFEIEYNSEFDISYILKGMDFRFKDEHLNIAEKLIDYMLLVREFDHDNCFAILNVRDFIEDEKIDDFYRTVLYNKLRIIIFSAHDHPKSNYEHKIIIDEDLCEF